MSTIPFDEIVPGATVRFTTVDGVQYLSVRDVIMHICGKNAKRANEKWDRLSDEVKDELAAFCGQFQFHGPGKPTLSNVITFKGAVKLAMSLSGERAAMVRTTMVSILSRYYAGDGSLTDEIEANAASTSPVAEMARNALSAEGTVENPKKRPRISMEFFANEVSTILKSMESEIAGHLNIISAGQGEAMMVLSQVDAKQDDIYTKLYDLDVQLKTEKEVNLINSMSIVKLTDELKEVSYELKARQDKIKKQEMAISCLNTTIRAKDTLLAKANSSIEALAKAGSAEAQTAILGNQAAMLVKLDLILERH